ncbi:MAG: hypothetical protein KGL35_02070 [Bradyrhizobium sp.]|nr:hypothetical protein [Bradyrhizobium sp.]
MTRIHLLKAGTFRDMNGADVRFTAADIAAIAKSYDPKASAAPIVIGHPDVEDPAYGWASNLVADDDGLHADAEDVDPSFADLVRAGRYRTVSASLYRPDAPGNPKPGQWYLRHIGFLGAQPPAVKGLKRAQLAGDADGVATIELAGEGDAALWSQFTRWLKSHISADLADGLSNEPWNGDAAQWKTAEAYCEACLVDLNDGSGPKIKSKCHLPVREPDGDGLNRGALFAAQGALVGARGGVELAPAAKRAAAKKLISLMRSHGLTPAGALEHIANLSETDLSEADKEARNVAEKTEELAARETKLAEGEAALKAREKSIADAEVAKRKDAHVAFADGLIKDGKLLPVDKPVVIELLAALAVDGKVELADGKATKTVAIDVAAKDWLSRMPKIVPLGEHAPGSVALSESGDPDPAALAEAASTLVAAEQKKGNSINFAEAVRRVLRASEGSK